MYARCGKLASQCIPAQASLGSCKVVIVRDPSYRAGTEQGQAILEDFGQAVDNVVKVIADPSVPRGGPTGISSTLFAMDDRDTPARVQGYTALRPKEAVVFFVVPAGWQRAVESSLSDMVLFETIDPDVGFQELDQLLHPKARKAG